MRWKIFYDDGSELTDQDRTPELVVKTGVQVVVMEDRESGRVVCRDNDFYIWHDFDGEMGWQGVDWFGFYDYLQAPGPKVVLFGRTIGNLEYRAVLQRAYDDPYLPQKTNRQKWER